MSNLIITPDSLETQNESKLSLYQELISDFISKGNIFRFQARGGSMFPVIRDGDILKVKPIRFEGVKIGDILLCSKQSGCFSAHRLVKKSLYNPIPYLITKADAKLTYLCDPPIYPAELLGKVITIERNGRIFDLEDKLSQAVSFITAFLSAYFPLILGFFRKSYRFFIYSF